MAMKDMLVKLYDLPKKCKELEDLSKSISFRRPLAAEKSIVNKWVKNGEITCELEKLFECINVEYKIKKKKSH